MPKLKETDAKQHLPFNHIFNANASTRSQTSYLSKTLKNVELKTLYMSGRATQVCLNASQCIVCINESNISEAPVCPNEAQDTGIKTLQLMCPWLAKIC